MIRGDIVHWDDSRFHTVRVVGEENIVTFCGRVKPIVDVTVPAFYNLDYQCQSCITCNVRSIREERESRSRARQAALDVLHKAEAERARYAEIESQRGMAVPEEPGE